MLPEMLMYFAHVSDCLLRDHVNNVSNLIVIEPFFIQRIYDKHPNVFILKFKK